MKKIILLVLLLFSLSGCSDYKEVNEMAIISAIGIDYQDNEFAITLETFNNKVDKDSGKVTTYTRTGYGKSISMALEHAADLLSQRAYYSHIKLCVISEEVARNHLNKVADFFIRSTYLRENFSLVVAKIPPEEVLQTETEENPISSIAINLLLQTNSYASNYAIDKPFDMFLKEVISYGQDGAISVINKEDNNFYIDGLAIFKDYKMVNILSNDDSVLYNILKGEIKKPVFELFYKGLPVSIALYDIKTDMSLKDDINLTGTYKAKIIENSPALNIKDEKVLQALDEAFSKYLNNQITDFIKRLQDNESDILSLSNNYFINTRIKNKKVWLVEDIKSDIKVVINKKGLVFNIYEDK